MKIAIVSTRGIPNNYGGFEQFAEIISAELVKQKHKVTVYNPHFHPFSKNQFNGVDVVKIFSPEKKLGTAANFIYDFLSLRQAIKNNHDIILCCGYTTAAVSFLFLNFKNCRLFVNVDGLEWKRSKYSKPIQKLALWFEKIAIKKSNGLISDNEGIQKYLEENYHATSAFIPYGAEIPVEVDAKIPEQFRVHQFEYDLLIARMEPENSIELILNTYKNLAKEKKILVAGSLTNRYGKFIYQKFKSCSNIIFLNWIDEKKILDSLRQYARLYIHGHRVGGTNPSLLEAMAAQALIVAHDNIFNKSVLKDAAFYFTDENQLAEIVNDDAAIQKQRSLFISKNLHEIKEKYNWERITSSYEKLFSESKQTPP